ncbi:MAG: YebC/PmpR family DNA-binding transcriptional regulator [Planctomycetaceae bacterium]|nr:YebC/PmpR family DNA-binding transcriptional regulator [Planctomycetaceae bacterium]
MSGHSHWAGIKHKKALVDAKRGKLWSKLSKAIIIAAKLGGADPDNNIRLRAAIDEARALSMPKDNILRAIKRGSGGADGVDYDEVIYEGYGAGGVAILAEGLTDNRNRTAPEIKKIFEVAGGKLGTSGCVSWNFEKKGVFLIPKTAIQEEALLELVLEASADDVSDGVDNYEVTCSPESYEAVAKALEAAKIEIESSSLGLVAKDTADITDVETAQKVIKLMEALDDHDDIQHVSSNFNITDEVMEQLEES